MPQNHRSFAAFLAGQLSKVSIFRMLSSLLGSALTNILWNPKNFGDCIGVEVAVHIGNLLIMQACTDSVEARSMYQNEVRNVQRHNPS